MRLQSAKSKQHAIAISKKQTACDCNQQKANSMRLQAARFS
jgi:hypothetical protein